MNPEERLEERFWNKSPFAEGQGMHNEGRADFFPVRQIDGTTGGHHNFNVEIPAVPAVPTQSQENQSLPPNASSPKTMTDIIVSVNGTLYGGCVVNGELGFPL